MLYFNKSIYSVDDLKNYNEIHGHVCGPMQAARGTCKA